jgi:hypothetical protein
MRKPEDVQKETVPSHPMRDDEGLNIDDDTGRPTPAEVTAGIILTAAQTGVALCIPGALEVRAARPASRSSDATSRAASAGRPTTAPDLERREHEREGGGAPSERGAKRESLFERLCHLF